MHKRCPPGFLRTAFVLAIAAPTVAMLAMSCDNDAIAVEACRQIESKRCNVARGCAERWFSPPITSDADVVNCELFYRDHCEYGIATDAKAPDDAEVAACLEAIDQAAACKGLADLSLCDSPPALAGGIALSRASACEVIKTPQHLLGCEWLNEQEKPEDDDEGGGSGGGGGSAGAASQGGTGGAGAGGATR